MSKRKLSELLDDESNLYGREKRWSRGELIGKGSSGSVYLATLKKPKRGILNFLPDTMAVKSAEIDDSAPLQKERMILNKLGGSYILKCYGEEVTIVGDRMVYNLLMEYGSGGTLADVIKKSGGVGLAEQDVKLYTRCMLLGLSSTHRLGGGYVHRDLAPENVVLVPSTHTSTGYVAKIGDYGSAKLIKNIEKLKLLEPYLRGRIRYLSPEAVINSVQVPASDVWALGCIVVEMLTGKSIWEGKTNSEIQDILYAIGKGRKVYFDQIPKGLSKEAKDFLRGCFAAKVDKRLTASELLCKPFVAGSLDEAEDEEGEENASFSKMVSNCSLRFKVFQSNVMYNRLMNAKRNIYKCNSSRNSPNVVLAGA